MYRYLNYDGMGSGILVLMGVYSWGEGRASRWDGSMDWQGESQDARCKMGRWRGFNGFRHQNVMTIAQLELKLELCFLCGYSENLFTSICS